MIIDCRQLRRLEQQMMDGWMLALTESIVYLSRSSGVGGGLAVELCLFVFPAAHLLLGSAARCQRKRGAASDFNSARSFRDGESSQHSVFSFPLFRQPDCAADWLAVLSTLRIISTNNNSNTQTNKFHQS